MRHLRREEAFEAARTLDLGELFLDALFQRFVPVHQVARSAPAACRPAAARWNARSPSRPFWSTSVNSRALRIASTAWCANVRISPIKFGENSPAAHFPQHHQRSQHALLVDQRHHQHRTKTGGDRDIAQQQIGGVGQIRDRDRLAFGGGFTERAVGVVDRKMIALDIPVDAIASVGLNLRLAAS